MERGLRRWIRDVFIACCGFNAKRTLRDLPASSITPKWRDLPAVRSGWVYVVNGFDYFSRPGPRLVDSLEISAHFLRPQVQPLPSGLPHAIQLKDARTMMVSG